MLCKESKMKKCLRYYFMESFGINLGIEIFIFDIDFFLYIFLLLL